MVKSVAAVSRLCVACGSCVRVCPRGALRIVGGMYAQVDREKCIGCAKCTKACPGGLIDLRGREDAT